MRQLGVFWLMTAMLELLAIPASASSPRTLRVGIFPTDVFEIGPDKASLYFHHVFLSQVGQTLIEQSAYGNVLPGIASAWTISPDRRIYHFKLRHDIRFHDGTPLDASQVVGSLNQAIYSRLNSVYYYARVLEGFEAGQKNLHCPGIVQTGPYEIELRLRRPYAPLLKLLSVGALVIQKPGPSAYFIGTGPYRVELRDSHPELVAFKQYKGNYPPHIERIQLLNDTKLLTGERELGINDLPDFEVLLPEQRRHLYSRSQYEFIVKPGIDTSQFYVNTTKSYWQNRQRRIELLGMLAAATRRVSLDDVGKPMHDFFPEGMLGHVEGRASLQRLRAQMAEAASSKARHFPDPIRVAVYSPIIGGSEKFAQSFYAINHRHLEFVQLTNDLIDDFKTKDFDVVGWNWRSLFLDPDTQFIPFELLGSLKTIDGGQHFSVLREQASISDLDDERRKIYSEMVDWIFASAVVLPFVQLHEQQVIRKNLSVRPFLYRYAAMLSDITYRDANLAGVEER